jgi:hypothetical protein
MTNEMFSNGRCCIRKECKRRRFISYYNRSLHLLKEYSARHIRNGQLRIWVPASAFYRYDASIHVRTTSDVGLPTYVCTTNQHTRLFSASYMHYRGIVYIWFMPINLLFYHILNDDFNRICM